MNCRLTFAYSLAMPLLICFVVGACGKTTETVVVTIPETRVEIPGVDAVGGCTYEFLEKLAPVLKAQHKVQLAHQSVTESARWAQEARDRGDASKIIVYNGLLENAKGELEKILNACNEPLQDLQKTFPAAKCKTVLNGNMTAISASALSCSVEAQQ